jgi:multidrug efflux system membrane fusion protein
LLLRLGNDVKADDTALLQINQLRPIYVAFAVPEQYLSRIRQRMREGTLKVTVSIPGETNASAHGELTFIDNAVDTTTGTIQLKAAFPNSDDALWPGQFVDVALTLSEEPNAVVVPSQAVQTGQQGEYVFVVKSDQTVEMRPVTLGPALLGETVVQSGIKVGETVVTDGQLRLVPGSKVNIKPALAQAPSGAAATNAP